VVGSVPVADVGGGTLSLAGGAMMGDVDVAKGNLLDAVGAVLPVSAPDPSGSGILAGASFGCPSLAGAPAFSSAI
jgi:hypothetical protein